MSKALRTRNECGAGLVSTMAGGCAFLAFLLLGTHILVGLYATSVTTASAVDAARLVARDPLNSTNVAMATEQLQRRCSSLRDVRIDWLSDQDRVGVHIRALRPSLLPKSLAQHTKLTSIDRTVWIRSEVEQ